MSKFYFYFYLLLMCLFLYGCADRTYIQRDRVINAEVVERDGCEYLIYGAHNRVGMTHKGDCKNLIHCHNK